MDIDSFGRTFLIDQATSLVIFTTKYNAIAKFLSSTILDSRTLQLGDHYLPTVNFDLSWNVNTIWVKFHKNSFSEYKESISHELSAKRNQCGILNKGYYLLLEQTQILDKSFDNISDLSIENLPYYHLYKDAYIQKFSDARNVPINEAKKHLEFIAECLKSIHLRKQELLWKYSNLLRTVQNENDYIGWRTLLLRETIELGQV